MKLLYVTDSCPWPPTSGGLLRHARLVEQLSRRHDVRVAVLGEPPPAGTSGVPAGTLFLEVGRSVESPVLPGGWALRKMVARDLCDPRPELVRLIERPAIRRAIDTLRPLAADSDAAWVAGPFLADQAQESWPGCRVLVDYIDISALAQFRQVRQTRWSPHRVFSAVDAAKMAIFERGVARKAWRAVVCKPEDAAFFGAGRNVRVVGNGTDPRPHLPAAEAVPGRMLFVGLMTYQPNADAAVWFARDILPRVKTPGASFDLVGKGPPDSVRQLTEGRPNVRVHGFAPDLAAHYRRATAVVAPIRLGAGTRLKVLEALGFGKPLVATTEACRGLGLEHDKHYLAADTPAEFAAACDRVLANPELAERLGHAGREFVHSRLTWDIIGQSAHRALTT